MLFLVATTAVKDWINGVERYDVHNSLIRGKTPCVCEPPLKLFAFPTIKKNSEARKTLDKAYETPRSQRETLGT